jgi:uncharacterized protein DUF3592
VTPNSARCLLAWLFAAVLLFRGGNALRESFVARNWPSANAVVAESDAEWVEHHRSVRMSMWTYELHLRYLYTINGRVYVGSRFSFSGWGPNERFNPFSAKIARDLPVGSSTFAYYDPSDYSRSVLRPAARFPAWIMFVLGMVLARAGFVFSQRVAEDKRRGERAALAGASA